MARKQKLNRAAIAKSIHKWNKKRFSPKLSHGTCDKCDTPLELDLFQKVVCAYRGGWKVEK